MLKPVVLSAAVLLAPRVAPVAPVLPARPVLPGVSAPTLSVPSVRLPAAPLNAAKPAEPSPEARRLMDRAPRMMELQAALLAVAARRTGQDALTLSLGMSMVGNGLSLADFDAMLAGLDELGAGLAEAAAALDREFEEGNLRRAFAPGTEMREGLSLLAAVMRDVAGCVEIRRNGRFMSWFWDYAEGRTAAAVDFASAGVRPLSGGRYLVTVGTVDGVPLTLTAATLGGKRPDLSRWVDGIERRAGPTPLRAALAAHGLLGD